MLILVCAHNAACKDMSHAVGAVHTSLVVQSFSKMLASDAGVRACCNGMMMKQQL